MKKITPLGLTAPTMPTEKKIRVAAYCRVSTDTDAQLESLAAQKSHYESMINARPDWEFAGLYYDEGISGTKKDKRPELLRMIADCEAGRIDMVITKSISRFARNTVECLEMVRRLLALGIPIYFESENLNTGSMESELLLSVMSSLAQAESTSISENTKWSIQKSFQNGTYKFHSPPYGYRWDGSRILAVPSEAETVKWIFRQVLSGAGTQAVANELNRMGVPTKRGSKWTSATICGMLKNRTYTGDVVLQQTYTDSQFNRHRNRGELAQYTFQNHHEAIVSHEDFAAANKAIEQHRLEKGIETGTDKYQRRYCFTGKILCGECGSPFKRHINVTGTKRYAVWCCTAHLTDKNRCSMRFVREDDLKAAFVRMINGLITDPATIREFRTETSKAEHADATMENSLRSQLCVIEEKQEMLSELMAKGLIDLSVFNEQNNHLLSEKMQIQAKLDTIRKNDTNRSQHSLADADLRHFVEKHKLQDTFDEDLFTGFVSRVRILSRNQIVFEMKSGISLPQTLPPRQAWNDNKRKESEEKQ